MVMLLGVWYPCNGSLQCGVWIRLSPPDLKILHHLDEMEMFFDEPVLPVREPAGLADSFSSYANYS